MEGVLVAVLYGGCSVGRTVWRVYCWQECMEGVVLAGLYGVCSVGRAVWRV